MTNNPQITKAAKALCSARLKASFTVEAAFVVPFFLIASVVILGLFPLLLVQVQVSNALQYSARMAAVSYREEEDSHDFLTLAEGELLFLKYLNEHGCDDTAILGGKAGISLLSSDFSGDYVEMKANYIIDLPIHFGTVSLLPVSQAVKAKKWTGRSDAGGGGGAGSGEHVYVTPQGEAYHSSTSCSYLDLSIHSVSVDQIPDLRSQDGSNYYPCSCYHGSGSAYITNYGREYHGSLECGGLKRTIYEVTTDGVDGKHPCPKCYGDK